MLVFFLLYCQIEAQKDQVTLQHRDTRKSAPRSPLHKAHTQTTLLALLTMDVPEPWGSQALKRGLKIPVILILKKYLFGIAQQRSRKACGAGGGSAR